MKRTNRHGISAEGGLTRKSYDELFRDAYGIDPRLSVNRTCKKVMNDLETLFEEQHRFCDITAVPKDIHGRLLTYELFISHFFNLAEFWAVLDEIREYEKANFLHWNFQYNTYHQWITIWFGDYTFVE